MIPNQQLDAAIATQRKLYTCLTEILELTQEMSQALQRQDQVSLRMFLSMRQDEINRAVGYRAVLHRQWSQLPAQSGELLRGLAAGDSHLSPSSPSETALLEQAKKNKALLVRIQSLDQVVSQRLGGPNSFYAKHGL